MKKVNKECVRQDQFLEEAQRYCVAAYPNVFSFRQMADTLADILLNALIHDTEDRNVSFGIGRALALWKEEHYLDYDENDMYTSFHKELREEVVKHMCNKMKIDYGDNGGDA